MSSLKKESRLSRNSELLRPYLEEAQKRADTLGESFTVFDVGKGLAYGIIPSSDYKSSYGAIAGTVQPRF